MNQREAFRLTLTLAHKNGMWDGASTIYNAFCYGHLADMMKRIDADPDMDEAKLGRWLGWAQCAVACNGFATLDDMKEINRRCANK